MSAERSGKDGGELVLEVPFEVRLEVECAATAEVVYDLLADLDRHLEWGGRDQKKTYRLTSMDAPPAPAIVGTEFRTTGVDPGGTFTDASVVTEATRPEVFEFVTEARQQPKRGEAIVWTNVHRYEIAPRDGGCTVRYSISVMRLSRRPWWMNRLGRTLVRIFGGANARVGLKNLVRMAEGRVSGDRAAAAAGSDD